MRLFCLLFIGILSAVDYSQIERESHLYRSERWIDQCAAQLTRARPPTSTPQTDICLAQASIWLRIEPEYFGAFPFAELAKREFWNQLIDLGVQAIDVHMLKQPNAERDYETVVRLAQNSGLTLLGAPLDPMSCEGPDFRLALASYKEYPHLFHLIELDPSDWKTFPIGELPMVRVQQLKKLGYLDERPELVYPYAKRSGWEATCPISGSDGKVRRWVFCQKDQRPVLNWLDPSFLCEKLAGGELVHALLIRSQTIVQLPHMPHSAATTLALLTRKLNGYSAWRVEASLEAFKEAQTDLIYDRFTPLAFLHALITEDAEALRQIYRMFLSQQFSPRRLVHELDATQEFLCEWNAFLTHRKTTTVEDRVTAELLAERLLNNDLLQLELSPSAYAPPIAPLFGLCPDTVPMQHKNELQQARLLLAFFYAMQGGAFSFSTRDLPGSSLFAQLHHRGSFAGRLKRFFSVRGAQQMDRAELIEVPSTPHRSLCLLFHRLPNRLLALTALNFSRTPQNGKISHRLLREKWVIELMSGNAEPKPFASDILDLQLDGLSGKLYLLQTKPFDGL
jgi:hypothetical protein